MGRPPIGKRAMSSAERQRRYWERVLQGGVAQPDDAALYATHRAEIEKLRNELTAAKTRVQELTHELTQAKAPIAEFEMQLAAKAEPSKPDGNEAAAVELMRKQVFKLVLRLDSPNEHEVLLAAQKLVRELKANGSDLRTLAAALETQWKKQQKAKSAPPPPIDF